MLHFKSSERVVSSTPNDPERYRVTVPSVPFDHKTLLGLELLIDGRKRVCWGFESYGVPKTGDSIWLIVETKRDRARRLKATEFPRAATEKDRQERGQAQPPLLD